MRDNLPLWSVLFGSNTIKPMVCCYEVAARIPHYRHIEFLESFNDVLAEASLIGKRVAGVVNAAVDAAAHVPGAWSVSRKRNTHPTPAARRLSWSLLSKSSIDVVVNLSNLVRGMYSDRRRLALFDLGEACHDDEGERGRRLKIELCGVSEENFTCKFKSHDDSGLIFAMSLKASWRSCAPPARRRCQRQIG